MVELFVFCFPLLHCFLSLIRVTVAKQQNWQLPIAAVLSSQLAAFKLRNAAEGGDCSYAAGPAIADFPLPTPPQSSFACLNYLPAGEARAGDSRGAKALLRGQQHWKKANCCATPPYNTQLEVPNHGVFYLGGLNKNIYKMLNSSQFNFLTSDKVLAFQVT